LLPYYPKVTILAILYDFMKRTKYLVVSLLVLIIVCCSSCSRNRYRVNISGIDTRIVIKRLEQDLFTGSPNDIPGKVPFLKEKYHGFLQLFSFVINIGNVTDTIWADELVRFCTEKQNNEVYASTIKVFPDVNMIEKGLTDGFRHYLYYFPGSPVPSVYTCITGFNNSIMTIDGDSLLGIGLDRYLGSDSKYYPMLQLYKYQVAKMNPANIVPDCIYGWATSKWDYKRLGYTTDDVLAEMIHECKLLYFVKCMLPDVDDDLIFGFSKAQMKFCLNSEGQMWEYLVSNNLLFSTAQLTKRKLTGEAPFTSYFSNESHGRAAVWIGFRIVESYMNRSKGTTLAQLMNITDIQEILQTARYSPK
jgi:hypothetical protein